MHSHIRLANRLTTVWRHTGEVEVQVRVTDMNDERPYFEQRVYTASVPENADKGSVIMTVTAEDNDEGYCDKRT